MKVYQKLAVTLSALKNCLRIHGESWAKTHRNTINACMEWSPSGSGFDSGTKLDEEATNDSKLVFNTSFHHMSEHGYSGWTEHKVSVTPGFWGINIKVSGRNKNNVKDYITDCFGSWLESEYMEPPTEEDKAEKEKIQAEQLAMELCNDSTFYFSQAKPIIDKYALRMFDNYYERKQALQEFFRAIVINQRQGSIRGRIGRTSSDVKLICAEILLDRYEEDMEFQAEEMRTNSHE